MDVETEDAASSAMWDVLRVGAVVEGLATGQSVTVFPERFAFAVKYEPSQLEEELYVAVTDYVEEMNSTDEIEGDNRRRTAVGFALTTLQRRLASSPAAIHQGGLLVDPKVALQQIEADNKGKDDGGGGGAGSTGGDEKAADDSGAASGDWSKGGGPTATPTRFHATKELTSNRVVRDAGQIYEEIVSHFVSNGATVRITLDIESDQLVRLTDDQRAAIREPENLGLRRRRLEHELSMGRCAPGRPDGVWPATAVGALW